jgi:hypothetical protein
MLLDFNTILVSLFNPYLIKSKEVIMLFDKDML